jgi:hypothetical protein
MGIEIDLEKIMNQDLCKITKHLGNTLLVDNMPYRTYLNLPFNAIFVKSYEYVPKQDNYLMKILLQ